MENVFVCVYCNSGMIPSYEGMLFEYPSSPQVITISDHMLLDALRKTIIDAIRGCRFLLYLFYR